MGKGGSSKGSSRFADVRSKFNDSRKGKGKGKRRSAAPLKSDFWVRRKDEENRSDVDGVFTGRVFKWVQKQGWGFIEPDDVSSMPSDVIKKLEASKEEAKEKAREKEKEELEEILVYFRKPDVDPSFFPVDVDDQVQFEMYSDDKGIGAQNVRAVDGAEPKQQKYRDDDGNVIYSSDKGKGKGKSKGRDYRDSRDSRDYRRDDRKDDRRGDRSAPWSKGSGKDKGREQHHVMELEEVDGDFPFRQKMVGEKGQNVHHIQDACGARVHISNRSPYKVDVYADDRKSLDKAVKMCEDLIGCIWEEYESSRKPRGRGGKSGGKGKDSGKRGRK